MNYLALAQRLRRKCRVPGQGPVAVTGQNEEFSRLLDYLNEAWMAIQTARPDWQWMRAPASFPTVAGKAFYTPAEIGITDFGNWELDTWRCYRTDAGFNSEHEIFYREYKAWRDLYLIGASRSAQTVPVEFTITPDKMVGLGPPPLPGYTVTGYYYRAPSEMVDATDIPSLPAEWHMAIIYRAMMFYGASEAAPEIYQEGTNEFSRMMTLLQAQQLPEIYFAGALA